MSECGNRLRENMETIMEAPTKEVCWLKIKHIEIFRFNGESHKFSQGNNIQ